MLPLPSHIYAGKPLVFQEQSLVPLAVNHPLSPIPLASPHILDTGPMGNSSLQNPMDLMQPELSVIRPELIVPVPKHDLVWHFGL